MTSKPRDGGLPLQNALLASTARGFAIPGAWSKICQSKEHDEIDIAVAAVCRFGVTKVSDEITVPLCRIHHRQLHRHGNETTAGMACTRLTTEPALRGPTLNRYLS